MSTSQRKSIKLDVHSHKGIMIGYGGGTNQYRIWDFTRKDIVISRDVVFFEGKPIEQTPAAYIEETRHDPITVLPETPIIHDSITVLPRPPRPQRIPTPALTEPDYPSDSDDEEPVDSQILLQESSTATQKTSARSNKGTFTSTKFADEDFDKGKRAHVANMARNTDPNDEEEPATIYEAINHPTRGEQWEKAIRDEVKSLIKNHTWDYAPRPRGRQVVSNKFVFKHKKNEIGQIVRLKARLVVRGFSRIHSVDYLDTYAPVVKLTSIRILLAIAAI